MKVKKIRLKCGVKNCRNTVSYMLSKSKEMGSSVVICPDCLKEAYDMVFAAEKAEKAVKAADTQAEKVEEKAEPIKREPAHRTTTTRSRGK